MTIASRLAALEARHRTVPLPRTPEQRRESLRILYTLEASIIAFHAGGWRKGNDAFEVLERALIALQPSYKRCLSWGSMQCLGGRHDVEVMQDAFTAIGDDRADLWNGFDGILERYPELDLTRGDKPQPVFFGMYADTVSANQGAESAESCASSTPAQQQPHHHAHGAAQ